MSGRLPDPGMGAICGRCGEPREAHGGPRSLGACPGESGIAAKRFSIAAEDRPQPEEATSDRLPLPPHAGHGVDGLATWLRAQLDDDEQTWAPALAGARRNGKTLARQMLAEVDAKRRILDMHQTEDGCCYTCSDKRGDFVERSPCPTVRLLALPMAGRDGYQESWRP